MKKLFLLLAISIFVKCNPVIAGITFGSISQFTAFDLTTGKATTPLGLQYGADYLIADSVKISGMNIIAPKIFAAVGISHAFNGETTVVNYAPFIFGLAFQPIKNVPLNIGGGAGLNAVNGKFICGFNTEYEITPIVTGFETAARAITKKPKLKGNLKISLF